MSDEQPASDPSRFVVRGRVVARDGRPLPAATIRVFDADFRWEEILGETETDAEGRYEVAYTADQFRRGEKQSADLIVRAFSRGVRAPLVESPIHFNASAEAVIDLRVWSKDHQGPSEFERYLSSIGGLTGDVPPAEFTAEDVVFLAGETGLPAHRLACLATAHRHERTTGVPAAAFYGLFRQQLPTALTSLLLVPSRRRRAALEQSVAANIAPHALAGRLDDIERTLRELQQRPDIGAVRSAPLLTMASAAPERLAQCVELYQRADSLEDFWRLVGEQATLSPAEMADLRILLQAGVITDQNAALVRVIKERGLLSPRALSDLNEDDWRQLIDSTRDGQLPLPVWLPGETEAERVASYVRSIAEGLDRVFPAERIRRGLARQIDVDAPLLRTLLELNPTVDWREPLPASVDFGTMSEAERDRAATAARAMRSELLAFPQLAAARFAGDNPERNPFRSDLARFLERRPDFDLGEVRLADVASEASAFEGIEDKDALVANLKRMQRVYRIAPRYEHMQALLGHGIHSAFDLAGIPPANFVRDLGDALGGPAQAKMYYASAQHKAAAIAALYAAIHQGVKDVTPVAAGGKVPPSTLKQVPNWEQLFGSLDFCDCNHCQSVYGPSAYLVDLLQFLRKSSTTPFTALMKRRPDIQHLKLTCENTHTPLPYVDLVNEVLEFYVAHGSFANLTTAQAIDLAKNTGAATAGELAVNPQYVNEAAYEALRNAVYSTALPFHRSVAVGRIYLTHLGASPDLLMSVFQNVGGQSPSDASIALEAAKITAEERDILTGASTQLPRAFFGYAQATAVHVDADGSSTVEPWRANLARVPQFLRRTGLSFSELTGLLKTRFINPDQSAVNPAADAVVLFSPDNVCDLNVTWIQHPISTHSNLDATGLSDARWLRLHRFVRLWKKLGWTLEEVDEAIITLGSGTIDAALLEKLSYVHRLRAELDIPVLSLLAFWGPIHTFGDASLFARLFQNKAVTNPVDPAFALSTAGTELADLTAAIDDHLPALLAAFRCNGAELAALREGLQLQSPAATLSLAILSTIYRHIVLARALKLRPKELISLQTLSGSSSFSPADPKATWTFVGLARDVMAAGFAVPKLDYLYRHVLDPLRPVAPLESAVALVLGRLRADLRRIHDETALLPDPTGELLRARLAIVLEPAVVDAAVPIVEGTSSLNAADQATFIDTNFALFLDAAEAKTKLIGSPLAVDERRSYVLSGLLGHLRQTASRGQIVTTLSTNLRLNEALARFLLETALTSPSSPGSPLLSAFLDLAGSAALETFVPAYTRAAKAALLLGSFEATPDEVAYLGAHGADFAGFNLSALPLNRDNPSAIDQAAPQQFAAWRALRELFALRDRLPQGDLTLLDVIAAPTAADGRARLAALTGWPAADIDFLSGPEGLGLADSAFKNASAPTRLFDAFRLSRTLGPSVVQLRNWAKEPPDAVRARQIVEATKAKYDDDVWRQVGRALSDQLREKQQEALIAYLLADAAIVAAGVADANQLFEYFLIDVKMSPCMKTSRVKQAISSVQLFVQRTLMNLEPAVAPSLLDPRRWKWMKHYRVWEANRKVFLYPENWIEPELRDDKTPIFKELEGEVLQQEVTDESAERILLAYLEKLDDVARLQVVGLCREKGIGVDCVHLFARSLTAPPVYYYRTFDVRKERFSAWEAVGVDIESDHLIPVVWDRRLHLFWPVFTERPDNELSQDLQLPSEAEALSRREIRLAWVERQNGRWSKKFRTRDALSSPLAHSREVIHNGFTVTIDNFYLPTARDHYFRVFRSGDRLTVSCARKFESNDQNWAISTARDQNQEVTSLIVLRPYSGWLWGHDDLGSFQFLGCRGRSELVEAGVALPKDTPKGPEASINAFMGFESEDDAFTGPLAFQDADSTTVLEQTGAFGLLHAPDLADPSKLYFPFAFQDRRRVYFAMPTASSAIAVTVAKNPPLMIDAATHEALVDQFADLGPPPGLGRRLGSARRQALAAPRGQPLALLTGTSASAIAGVETALADATPALAAVATAGTGPAMTPMIGSTGPVFSADSGESLAGAAAKAVAKAQALKFHILFHPHVCALIKRLRAERIDGLLALASQQITNEPKVGAFFKTHYLPTGKVHTDYPREDVDFTPEGAYSVYNWEIFFHAPLLLADRLSTHQQFEAAQRWFHFIFDPTNSQNSGSGTQRFWRFRPFHENTERDRIEELLAKLSHGKPYEKKKLEQHVAAWRDNPFNPHLIARTRMVAYQKTVVRKYIDNLIRWADHLFALDTIESINEATQLYVLAANLLGRRPERIPQRGHLDPKSYHELRPALDAFSNAYVELENEFPFTTLEADESDPVTGTDGLGTAMVPYFCIPSNELLLQAWDTVEDRLFKIRHCMNIEGIVRELPLFEPPIDPALLVKAQAMGLDLGSVLSEASAPPPHYRFAVLLQKALDMCGEVKSLGQMLLSVLEKRDAEALARLRATHESALLRAMRELRTRQIEEARIALEAIRRTRAVVEARELFYRTIKDRVEQELLQVSEMLAAQDVQSEGQDHENAAADVSTYMPDFSVGVSGMGGHSTVSIGRSNIVAFFQARSSRKRFQASEHTQQATLAGIEGAWTRRAEEWGLHRETIKRELQQIDRQITAAEIRLAIAEKELETHERQIEQAEAALELLTAKYTNEELFAWMQAQVAGVYFQAYKLAYDLAKRAERAYMRERGVAAPTFVQFGYWDSLRKGLLAGEGLTLDLKRLELAYLDQGRREFEIARTVALSQIDPLALIALRETGSCEVELSEDIFDMDYPGHYFRRLKNVGLTLPCIVGPYASVNCTLTLLSSRVRIDPGSQSPYPEDTQNDDPRFLKSFGAIESVVTSGGQNDAGLFEVNLHDDRFLPFEGAGAVSTWRIELPRATNAFDVDTLSDVIMHVRFTARDGGTALREKARAAVVDAFPKAGLVRLFSARHEFSNEWHRFLHPPPADTTQTLALGLLAQRFPFPFRRRDIVLNRADVFLKLKADATYEDGADLAFSVEPPGGAPLSGTWTVHPMLGLPHAKIFGDQEQQPIGTWALTVEEASLPGIHPDVRVKVTIGGEDRWRLNANAIEDLWVVCTYTVA
jgi:hypothetical protein